MSGREKQKGIKSNESFAWKKRQKKRRDEKDRENITD